MNIEPKPADPTWKTRFAEPISEAGKKIYQITGPLFKSAEILKETLLGISLKDLTSSIFSNEIQEAFSQACLHVKHNMQLAQFESFKNILPKDFKKIDNLIYVEELMKHEGMNVESAKVYSKLVTEIQNLIHQQIESNAYLKFNAEDLKKLNFYIIEKISLAIQTK